VAAWLDRQIEGHIHVTAITVFGLRKGQAQLPASASRTRLERMNAALIDDMLGGRVIPLGRAAARIAGDLHAARKRTGTGQDMQDTLIAGIAIANRATLATRNTRHFADLPTPVVDPWVA